MVRQSGFTLIELVAVIALVGIIAVTAAPRFINFSSDARTQVLHTFSGAVKTANNQLLLLSKLPSYRVRPVTGRGDLTDVDVDADGSFETRLKCGYLDNTDVIKRIDYSDDQLFFQYEGSDKVYFGFQRTNIRTSQCYFMYQQSFGRTSPSQCDSNTLGADPTYEVVATGC